MQNNRASKAEQSTRPRFARRAGLALIVILAGAWYIHDRYRIGIDDQVDSCLPPYRWFIIDRWDRRIERYDLIAFRAIEPMQALFPQGQTVIKRVMGLPGDRVIVDEETITINGWSAERRVCGLVLAPKLGHPPQHYIRNLIVPAGRYWVMGETDNSYDSRYWGTVGATDIIGQAHAVY